MQTEALNGKRIWVLVGTRPEVIKQAPLYLALVKKFGKEKVALIGTGQHRELLEQALNQFKIKLDINFEIMKPNQSLASSSAAVLIELEKILKQNQPEWIVVQGDTTTAAMAAWCGFMNGIKVAHNEAGLRSHDLQHPFPEEANRRLVGIVADLHFAPTELARSVLLREGTASEKIHLTGNTGIDALRITLAEPCPPSIEKLSEELKSKNLKPVLITAHRRENRNQMDQWFGALHAFLDQNPDLFMILPLHPNHSAKDAATKYLGSHPRARMVDALSYGETGHLLKLCAFTVTDSGGIQEEASSLGIPVVVCRKTTERSEAVTEKRAQLAGTDPAQIIECMKWAQNEAKNSPAFDPAHPIRYPIFGDGFAADRMIELLK